MNDPAPKPAIQVGERHSVPFCEVPDELMEKLVTAFIDGEVEAEKEKPEPWIGGKAIRIVDTVTRRYSYGLIDKDGIVWSGKEVEKTMHDKAHWLYTTKAHRVVRFHTPAPTPLLPFWVRKGMFAQACGPYNPFCTRPGTMPEPVCGCV